MDKIYISLVFLFLITLISCGERTQFEDVRLESDEIQTPNNFIESVPPCEKDPNTEICLEYCIKTPSDPACLSTRFCDKNPSHPSCQTFCQLFPTHESCKKDNFDDCKTHPNTPSCIAYCMIYPYDPDCSDIVDCFDTPLDRSCLDFCEAYPTDPLCNTSYPTTLKLNPIRDVISPRFKIFIIADNSLSMFEERSQLASDLNGLFDYIQNIQIKADIYIYSTSDFLRNREDWKNGYTNGIITQYLYNDANGNPVISYSAPTGRTSYTKVFSYMLTPTYTTLSASAPRVRPGTPIALEYDNPNFDTAKANIINAIIDLGPRNVSEISLAGSQKERGLCTLGRILVNKTLTSNDSPFNGISTNNREGFRLYTGQDKAAFLVISDEDNYDTSCKYTEQVYYDYSKPQNNYITTTNIADTHHIDYKQYYSVYYASINYNTTCTNDGISYACTSSSSYKLPKTISTLFPSMTWTTNSQTCPEDFKSYIATNYGHITVDKINTCTYKFYTDSASYTDYTTARFDKDLCIESFSMNGTTYTDIYDYLIGPNHANALGKSSCTRTMRMIDPNSVTPTSTTLPDVTLYSKLVELNGGEPTLSYTGQNKFVKVLADYSRKIFGSGFFFSSIIRTGSDQGICPTTQIGDFSTGTQYSSLATELGTLGLVNSICLNNYMPAITPLESFIEIHINNSFLLSMRSNQVIKEIILKHRDGTNITLTSTQYQVRMRVLEIEKSLLTVDVSEILVDIE